MPTATPHTAQRMMRSQSPPSRTHLRPATYVATACSNCKRQLTQLMEHHREKIAVGGVHDMLCRAILINGKAAEVVDYVH